MGELHMRKTPQNNIIHILAEMSTQKTKKLEKTRAIWYNKQNLIMFGG